MIDDMNSMRSSIAAPLFDLKTKGYFTSAAGYTNARYCPFTDAAKHIYSQILSILDYYEVEYYLFAGSLVGYVRNGRMPPWMDDIDIMIFKEHIALFEEKVLPRLRTCGFNCKPAVKQPDGAGYHILAMQKKYGVRKEAIPYSATQDIAVPWAQLDVFFSEVDDNNFIRNIQGWGLYHKKNVPYSWVYPPKKVEMDGLEFTTFSDIEADVKREYGDVRNELVVRTHNRSFLQAASLEWEVMDQAFTNIVEKTISPLTPGLSNESYKAYSPVDGAVFEAPENAGFDEIMQQIVKTNASDVRLTGDDQILWVMDIKRLVPNITIAVRINDKMAARIAAHLRQFINEITVATPALAKMHSDIVESFTAVLGDRVFPGLRKYDQLL